MRKVNVTNFNHQKDTNRKYNSTYSWVQYLLKHVVHRGQKLPVQEFVSRAVWKISIFHTFFASDEAYP